MSYEEMQARLDRERERTRQLSEELRAAKCPDGDRIKTAVKEAAAKPPNMAQTNHNIPHRSELAKITFQII